MHRQRETAKTIIDKQADYFFAVKRKINPLEDEFKQSHCRCFSPNNPTSDVTVSERLTEDGRRIGRSACFSVRRIALGSRIGAVLQTIRMICSWRENNGMLKEPSTTFHTSLHCKVGDRRKRTRRVLGMRKQKALCPGRKPLQRMRVESAKERDLKFLRYFAD